MFACRFPKHLRLTDHQSALAFWEKSPKKKGHIDSDWRDPFGRPRDNTVVRKDSWGQIKFRLYGTDVVTFCPDNTVVLAPHASPSTNNFVRAVLGGHIWTYWSDRSHPLPDMVTHAGGRLWHTPEYATIQYDPLTKEWQMLDGNVPFAVPQLDRSAARKLLKTSGLKTFELWLRAQLRLGIDPRSRDLYGRHAADHTSRDVLRALDDMSQYGTIAAKLSAYRTPDDLFREMRLALYKFYGICDTTEVDSFANWGECDSAFGKMRKYG
jgi:hypothetical protein